MSIKLKHEKCNPADAIHKINKLAVLPAYYACVLNFIATVIMKYEYYFDFGM